MSVEKSKSPLKPTHLTAASGLPPVPGQVKSETSSIGDGGIKMKDKLSKEGQPKKEEDGKGVKNAFSPGGGNAMSNFFSGKGPVRPQAMLPTEAMINIPAMQLAGGPVRVGKPPQQFALHSRPGMQMDDQFYGDEEYDDEYYDEAEVEGAQQRMGGRMLSHEEEEQILHFLTMSA